MYEVKPNDAGGWNLYRTGDGGFDLVGTFSDRKDAERCRNVFASGVPLGAYCLFREGDQWCAVAHDFINLQESKAGFGSTATDALDALLLKLSEED